MHSLHIITSSYAYYAYIYELYNVCIHHWVAHGTYTVSVFASEAQSGVHSLMEWRDVGIGRVRVELVDENTDDTERILRGYLGVLSGDIRPRDVWEELKDVRDSNGRAGGVSHGSLRNNVERRAGEL